MEATAWIRQGVGLSTERLRGKSYNFKTVEQYEDVKAIFDQLPEELHLFMYTGGSTGFAKGAARTKKCD